jgi:spore coat protein A, manganese oxidase
MQTTRREFLRGGAAAGVSLVLPWHIRLGRAAAEAMPTLDAAAVTKYVTSLVVPPAMPLTSTISEAGRQVQYYEIAVRQFQQQVLPGGLPATTVWSYGSVNHPVTFNYPAFTVEAAADVPVRVKWVNGLVDSSGRYLPHLLPVDPTLHWANPPGGVQGRDGRSSFTSTPGPYTGPVPIVTHLHGGHTSQESDGYPEAWYLPRARNIGRHARFGTQYQPFRTMFQATHHDAWTPGNAVYQYDNDQAAATLWYHDHTLGITRLNVYAGPAGFYLLRGGPFDTEPGMLPGPAPAVGEPPGTRHHEIPLAIQDRSFNADGSLFYPDSRAFFDGFDGPYFPHSDVSPIWNPEFFGDTMLVNGNTWPVFEVEPRRYRFRILNGCNSRFVILKLTTGNPEAPRPVAPDLPLVQIGADGGFLPSPVQLDEILLSPAERADVIVDFTDLPQGTAVYLINEGPDEPFGGGTVGVDFDAADPATTGQVMKFVVGSLEGTDTSEIPSGLPAAPKPGPETATRQVSLNEESSTFPGFDGPVAALLGTVAPDGTGEPLGWDAPITENPAVGTTEVWEMHNLTEDAHPIHIHEVLFEVVDRQPLAGGPAQGPEPGETGLKDTVIAYPDQTTRVRAHFDRAGLFVWHCHILEHEDHEMMRPYRIGP